MDNLLKETHVVSVMSSNLETAVNVSLLLHPFGSRKRLTARDNNHHRDQAIN